MSTPPIPRYEVYVGGFDELKVKPDADGEWIKYDDYVLAFAAMQARAEKAEAQLAEVTADFKAAMSEMRDDAGLGHHELNDNQRQSIQCMIEAYADQYLPSEPTEGAKT